MSRTTVYDGNNPPVSFDIENGMKLLEDALVDVPDIETEPDIEVSDGNEW